jgi:hypothetical protein
MHIGLYVASVSNITADKDIEKTGEYQMFPLFFVFKA